jgi:hypothetical protein
MDRASHLLGKCSEYYEIICVEKAVLIVSGEVIGTKIGSTPPQVR